MPDSILALLCHGDDFCQAFDPRRRKQLVTHGVVQRQRARRLCLSEVMTIVIAFHTSHYRNFTAFYLSAVPGHWRTAFPGLVSFSRFVDFLPSTASHSVPICGNAMVPAPVSPLWTPPLSRCVTIGGLPSTASLRAWRNAAKPHWADSLASSCICLSMTRGSYWR